MNRLIQGLHRFRSDIFMDQERLYKSLAEGQNPDYLFITCCDSRVQPEILLQANPGDLFILRNIGNLVPPHGSKSSVEAAVEYSVRVLGVTDIIVCGHSHCGAMAAILNPESLADLPTVKSWMTYADATTRIIQENYGHLEGDARLDAAIQENVLVQLEHLMTLPSVSPALMRRELKLHGWVYRFETGSVLTYSAESDSFVEVGDDLIPAIRSRRTASNAARPGQ